MNIERGSTAFSDPLFHFISYGLQNPMVQWCVEAGVYQPGFCPGCRGDGQALGIYGEKVWSYEANGRKPWPCRSCGGTGHRRDRAPHAADFEDADSLRLAKALGVQVQEHKYGCRAKPGNNRSCECILR